MNKKYIILVVSFLIALVFIGVYFGCRNNEKLDTNTGTIKTTSQEVSNKKSNIKPKIPADRPQKGLDNVRDLYATTPYDVTLSSVVEISKLPLNVKKSIDDLLEKSQGFYFVKVDTNKKRVIVALQNPISDKNVYSRHDLEFVEIPIEQTNNLKEKIYSLGYSGENGEIFSAQSEDMQNDLWDFDKTVEPQKPLKHVHYDVNGDVLFVETWNYDTSEPIKYEMKDKNGKIVSVMRETVESENNYHKEHVFYDKDGHTEKSLSVNYDGANISRMTYYNAKTPNDGIMIMSEFEDGQKSSETVYNQDYKLINIIKSDYVDGERKTIKVFDENNQEIEEIK